MPQRNLLILFLAVAVSFACYVRGEQNPYARYAATGLAVIERDALDEVPGRELFHGAMQGMIEVLRRYGDVHSQFLDESEAEPVKAEIRQQFGGIGVRIQLVGDPQRLVIVGPPDPGTPAARANLLPGDHILAIDDHPTADMTMADVLRRMRGRPGDPLQLTIRHEHEQQPRKVELVREIIPVDSILGDVRGADGKWQFRLAEDPRVALVRITAFGDRTADELEAALERLTDEGIEAVVLDMRDNAGGALDAAVAVCELLLPPGRLVVETRGRDRQLRQQHLTRKSGRFRELPLAVLVNQNSASAAEIVAASLQDHQRAIVGGQRTYGKGTVQQLLPLESGRSLLKLTWASFWRPSGVNMHRMPDAEEDGSWGVKPDSGLEVILTPEQYAAYRRYRNERDTAGPLTTGDAPETPQPAPSREQADPQLQKVVEYLSQQMG